MQAILTVYGKDTKGIVAKVATKVSEVDGNILDITQTIMGDMFTMMMLVSLSEDTNFKAVKEEFKKLSDELKLSIHLQNSEIFDSMHKI
jgi:ACT domain-containing protein